MQTVHIRRRMCLVYSLRGLLVEYEADGQRRIEGLRLQTSWHAVYYMTSE